MYLSRPIPWHSRRPTILACRKAGELSAQHFRRRLLQTSQLKGIEEMRFPPGWGVAGSDEYFSVSFLLWLDSGQTIDESVLEEMFRRYFDGLISNNTAKNVRDKIVPTKVLIKKIKPEPDDLVTYAGTIDILDYMALKPLRQNVLVHIKACADPSHVPVFFEISPKPYDDTLWTKLKSLKQQFSCTAD